MSDTIKDSSQEYDSEETITDSDQVCEDTKTEEKAPFQCIARLNFTNRSRGTPVHRGGPSLNLQDCNLRKKTNDSPPYH